MAWRTRRKILISTQVNPNPISKARVPYLGGGCSPQIDVYEDHDSARPNGRVTGPCCFGGCSEFCCESKFLYRTLDGRDVSRVRKLVPGGAENDRSNFHAIDATP